MIATPGMRPLRIRSLAIFSIGSRAASILISQSGGGERVVRGKPVGKEGEVEGEKAGEKRSVELRGRRKRWWSVEGEKECGSLSDVGLLASLSVGRSVYVGRRRL